MTAFAPSNPLILTPSASPFAPSFTAPTSGLYQVNPYGSAPAAELSPFGNTGTVLNSLGVPVPAPQEADPAQMSSDIESSLAKLDTVNPDLANQMRQQYLGTDTGDSGGLFGIIGDIGHAITSGAGALLDIIGRTAHIVPAMLVHDSDPWYQDIGQALTGQDKSTWNDVLMGWGWTGGGLSGVLRGALGFVGDVATDPLTWALGAGSLAAKATTAEVAAKAGFTAAVELGAKGLTAEAAVELGLHTPEALAKTTELVWNSMKGEGTFAAMVKNSSPEVASQILAGSAGTAVQEGAYTLMKDAWWAASRNYERVTSSTIKSFLRSGLEDTLPSGAKMPAAETKRILEGIISRGNWANPRTAKAVTDEAKAAAGVMGGLRFTPFVPWTSLRYMTPTLPFTMGTLSKPLNIIARFGAGKSVVARAEALVKNLGPEASAALSLLHQEGLNGLKNAVDPAAKELYERLMEGGVIRSAFYRASERTGQLTAAFTPGAKQFRQGLGYYFAESYKKAARATVSNITKNDLYDTVRVGTSAARGEFGGGEQKLYASFEQVLHISNRAGKDTATAEERATYSEFLDNFGGLQGQAPISNLDVSSGKLDAWFWDQPDVRGSLEVAAESDVGDQMLRTQLQAKLDDMKRVLAAVPEGDKRNVLLSASAVWARGNDIMASYGIHSRDIGWAQLELQRVIHPDDAHIAMAGTTGGVRAKKWYIKLKGSEGATGDDVLGHAEEGLKGILVYDHPVEGSIEVALNLRKPLKMGKGGDAVDQGVQGILGNEPILLQARLEAERGMQNTLHQMVLEGKPTLPDSMLSPERWDDTLASVTSDILRKRGGFDYDSVFYGDRIMLLGTNQIAPQDMVWALSEHAARLQKTHGYLPRTLTRQAREFLAGVPTGRNVVRSIPDIEARMVRASANKTLREADQAMRDELVAIMREQGVPEGTIGQILSRDKQGNFLMPLLEQDPLKTHEHYVRRVGEGVWSSMMGTEAERLDGLGKLLPNQFGRIVHIETARAIVDTSAYSMVRKAGKKAEASVTKMLKAEKTYLDAQLTDNEVIAQNVAELLRRWELGEDVDLTDIAALNPQMQRLLRTSDNFQATLRAEQEKLARERELWQGRADDLAKVEELLKEQLGIEDPMVVEKLGQGQVRVTGFHWTMRPELPSAPDPGSRISSGGLHIGDKNAALGRGGQSPQVDIVAKNGDVVDTVDLADAQATIDELVQNPNSNWTLGPNGETVPESFSAVPSAPDINPGEEGNLFPVRIEGKFLGADKPVTDLEAHVLAGLKNGDYVGAMREPVVDAGGAAAADSAYRTAKVEAERLNNIFRDLDTRMTGKYNGNFDRMTAKEHDALIAAQDKAIAAEEARDQLDIARTAASGTSGGSGRWQGLTSPAQLARARALPNVQLLLPQDLADFDGVIYKNAVEGRTITGGNASSAIIFPDSMPKAMDLQVEVTGMLNNGELGIAPDGSVLTRAGRFRDPGRGGARRVYSRQEVDQAVSRAEARVADLERFAANPYLAEGTSTGTRRASVEVAAEEAVKARTALGVAVSREVKNSSKVVGEAAARKQRLGRELTEAMANLNDIRDVYQNAQAKLIPAVVSGKQLGGHSFMTQVDVAGFQGLWWHPYIAQELENQLLGKSVGAFRNAWREFVLNPWKKWATYRNPGFHVRNAMGAWFNNFLGGVTTGNYHFSQRVMSARDGGAWTSRTISAEDFKAMGLDNIPGVRELEKTMTYGNVADMLTDVGITRGSAAAVELVADTTKNTFRVGAAAAKPARWADQHLRRLSSTVEDYFRVAAWQRGMMHTPGDLYGARAFVMMRHGDYGDLTDTEDFIRDIVPFYKWMRTNVPFQIRMMAARPGYMTAVGKAQKSIFDMSGLSAEEYMKSTPDWMKGSLAIPLPGQQDGDPVSVISLDLPFMDLYKGAREYASSFLPGVLPILESLVTKKVTYSGAELTGKMVPLAGWAQLPGIKQIVAALPFTQMGPDGQVYLPDTMENVLTGIPIYGRFRNWLTGDPNRVEKRWGALTSFMVGAPIRQIDLTDDEKAFFYDILTPQLEAYQSMGVVFPTKDELIAAGRLFQAPSLDSSTTFPTGVVGSIAA